MASTPHERAQFATIARLLSCLVTESLVSGFYLSLGQTNSEAAGFAVVLNITGPCNWDPQEILAIVPLHHPPIFRTHNADVSEKDIDLKEIGLLDPFDMIPLVFETGGTDGGLPELQDIEISFLDLLTKDNRVQLEKSQLHKSTDALSIWNKFSSGLPLNPDIRRDIASEFSSAIKWQSYSYEYPPQAPLFSSPSIVWEQSVVEGHPTHPMHKTRQFLEPLPDFSPGSYDLLNPRLRFISIPRDNVKVTYDFEGLTSPILKFASAHAGKDLVVAENRIAIPVHELQVFHIRDKFPDAYIYPEEFSLPLLAQLSLRSVVLPGTYRGLNLKLGVGIKLTSAVRTISPESAYFGPRFSAQVVPALMMDRNIVTVARELASVVHSHPNGEIAKHCAAIVREYHEDISEDREERLIVCASLLDRGHAGTAGHLPSVIRVFDLDTEAKCLQWLEKFVSVFLEAFLPPMLHNGVAFECHSQNCVARFDLKTKELKGFIIRDLGALRVHPETLKATTGVDIDFVDGHSVIASTLDDVYIRMYHTMIHNHFQRLIRVLGLHYNGLGWSVVRDILREKIPNDHPLHDAWLSPERTTLPGKCFLRMKMSSMYRFHINKPFPNLIHYTGAA